MTPRALTGLLTVPAVGCFAPGLRSDYRPARRIGPLAAISLAALVLALLAPPDALAQAAAPASAPVSPAAPAASAAVVAPAAARGPTEVRAVSVLTQAGGEVVRVELSQPLAVAPAGFSIQSPARIALDLPAVRSAVEQPKLDINQGNLRSLAVVEADDRTRLVLNLKQPTGYRTQLEGRFLLVLLDPAHGPRAAMPVATAESPRPAREGLALRDIDFRRGQGSTGRVLVELPNPQIAVDIRPEGQNLVLEFLGTTLPEGLRRRLDVTDFGTPVKSVTTTAVGNRVRMVIEPRGPWEHSAYQSDSQFVVELRPPRAEPGRLTQGTGYIGEKITLDFQAVEVRNLLQVFSDYANVNVVVADSVNGAITLRLKDVPWDQALDIILDAKSLKMRNSGNVLWIAPKGEVEARERRERE